MKHLNLLFFLCINTLSVYAQDYNGLALQVVDSLNHDSTLWKRFEMKLKLESWNKDGEKEVRELHYARFDNSWELTNEDFRMFANDRYVLVIAFKDSVAFLSEDTRIPGFEESVPLNSVLNAGAALYEVKGTRVSFLVRNDSVQCSYLYTVDTVSRTLRSVEIQPYDNSEDKVQRQCIHYQSLARLRDKEGITPLENIVYIRRRKATLLAPYDRFIFYDNRKEP